MAGFNFSLSPQTLSLLDAIRKRQEEDEQAQMLSQLADTDRNVISEQNPAPQQVELPEQRGGKDMVNTAVENAIPQAPNPYQLGLQRGIVAAKQGYADAKDDATRQTFNDTAELLRARGDAAGLDLNGYGMDVSLADAYKNLATQEGRAVAQIFQGGTYAMNSDQYYERMYDEAIASGLPPRRAADLAGSQTRDYQARRVAYLDGLYNGYGFNEDGTVNQYGNQTLAMLAHEDPMTANYYAQVYPNAKDAYTQGNILAQKAIENGYARDLLGLGFLYDTGKQDNVARHNIDYRMLEHDIKDTEDKVRRYRDRADAYDALGLASDEKRRERAETEQYLTNFFNKNNIPNDVRNVISAKVLFGVDMSKAEKNNTLKVFTDQQENLQKRQKNAQDIIKSEYATEEDKNAARAELAAINTRLAEIDNILNVTLGMSGNGDIPDYTGDFEADLQTVKLMAQYSEPDTPREDFWKGVKEWANQKGNNVSDYDVERLVNEIYPAETKEEPRKTQSQPARPPQTTQQLTEKPASNRSFQDMRYYNGAPLMPQNWHNPYER